MPRKNLVFTMFVFFLTVTILITACSTPQNIEPTANSSPESTIEETLSQDGQLDCEIMGYP
jgi:starvation-inducible outer membrane lipoprotein